MKYAQKMVLIPEEEYLAIRGKTHPVREEMKTILKGKRDHAAATKMSQLVGAYLRHKQKDKLPEVTHDNLLDHFEPIYHKKVTSFLSQLRHHRFEWNDKKELIIPSGKIVQHSNIIDLIKEALVSSRGKKRVLQPMGWEIFVEALAATSIPINFFTKQSTQEAIKQAQHHEWEVY